MPASSSPSEMDMRECMSKIDSLPYKGITSNEIHKGKDPP